MNNKTLYEVIINFNGEIASLELAKLLKENSFSRPTHFYWMNGDVPFVKKGLKRVKQGKRRINHNKFDNFIYSAPTKQEMLNWINSQTTDKNTKKVVKGNFEIIESNTILTNDILSVIGFKNNGKCEFDLFENMGYWVKNSICLFYNIPAKTDYQESFYIGYAEMRQGKYVAVGFRWIKYLEELTQIYESIINKPITDSI